MPAEGVLSEIKKNGNIHDYEYISNDPEENFDNFHPKWASFREMRTDEERYRAIRERWGNKDIPDPRINLTYRNTQRKSEKETSNSKTKPIDAEKCPPLDRSRRNRPVSRRRSRSCTRPYEQLISNIQKNYRYEYCQLMNKHTAELQEMLQVQFWRLGACNLFTNGDIIRQNLHFHQNQEMFNLLTHQQKEVNSFLGEKKENLVACVNYMEEVKAFFTFYQKINDDEVTLQMTDEQYEHTVETERMYSMYSTFYR